MSDEYTPSIEQVKIMFVGATPEFYRPDQRQRADQFDRWLAAHDAEVLAATADIESLLEESSLGTLEAQALRATVSDERAAEILRMAGITPTGNGETCLTYVVCDCLLDPETNRHCEFDGDVKLDANRNWRCPGCGRHRYAPLADIQAATGEAE